MNSKDWLLNNCNLSIASSVFLSDKETQTSKIYVIDTVSSKNTLSRPLPENIEAKAKDDNVKIFEFSEVIKDPNDPSSVSIITETFTEEALTEPGSPCDSPTKNKYKYCKEVIQPYSKTPKLPKDCPSYPTCKPDWCKGVNDQRDQEDCSKPDIIYTMDSDNSKKTFDNPSVSVNQSDDNCEIKEEKRRCCVKKTPCKPKPPAICKTIDECNLKKCISACVRESLKLAKKSSAACLDKFEQVIGVKQPKDCDDKPTYYVMDKCKTQSTRNSSTTGIEKKNSIQNIIESQSQTVATITCAIKGFVGSVYNKTKEAVNMIKTESCRHLGLSNEPESTSKENSPSDHKTKDCSGTVSDISPQPLNEEIENQTITAEEISQSYSFEKLLEPAKDAVEQVISVVASTVSVLKNSSFDDIIDSKINRSSTHDKPDNGKTTPRKIAQDHEPEAHSSVFTMLKAKILSIFDIHQDTCQDDAHSSDDDEESAEKLFEKFCEQ